MTRAEFVRIRKALGLTQERLAAELGRHKHSVVKWERGERAVNPQVATAMLRLANPRGGHNELSLWFELSYARYLTVPRSILEAMPDEWQGKLAALMREMDETFDWRPEEGRYYCYLRDAAGHFRSDSLQEYRHPDRGLIESLRRKASA